MNYISDGNFSMRNTCVAFGEFDGVHLGHRAVLDKLLETAGQGLTSVVVCTDCDDALLNGKKILSTAAEKKQLFSENGPEVLISYKIDEQNKDIPVESFVRDVIVGRLGAKAVVTGTDDPNIDALRTCAQQYGFALIECETVCMDGEPVTAERVIAELAQGTLEKANTLLGHPYLLLGEVMHGKALGRTVGMPTANLGYQPYKQLPASGVFGTVSCIGGRNVKGLTNIGKRPSVDDFNYVTIETFLLDFSGDLYGKIISLEIHVFIRGVVKFHNIEEVKLQVNKDIESIRAYLNALEE